MEKSKNAFYQKVNCPTCGNEIVVSDSSEIQKCKWCRRFMKVTVQKKGRKTILKAEEQGFEDIQTEPKKRKKKWTYTDRFF